MKHNSIGTIELLQACLIILVIVGAGILHKAGPHATTQIKANLSWISK